MKLWPGILYWYNPLILFRFSSFTFTHWSVCLCVCTCTCVYLILCNFITGIDDVSATTAKTQSRCSTQWSLLLPFCNCIYFSPLMPVAEFPASHSCLWTITNLFTISIMSFQEHCIESHMVCNLWGLVFPLSIVLFGEVVAYINIPSFLLLNNIPVCTTV